MNGLFLVVCWIVLWAALVLVWAWLILSLRKTDKKNVNPLSFHDLPTKNLDLSNKEQGLYNKYEVQRRDGSDYPGGKHHGCSYFVLDLTHDPYALETIVYYARACKETHPLLYNDLMDLARTAYSTMDDQGKL